LRRRAVIVVRLPRNRLTNGSLSVIDVDGNTVAGPFRCFGKADNAQAARHGNRSRNPVFRFGDTPSGDYRARFVASHKLSTDTYGVNGYIMMEPIGGDALVARRNGRSGLWIHGGVLRNGQLRPTFGCVRVDDSTMALLISLSNQYMIDSIRIEDIAN